MRRLAGGDQAAAIPATRRHDVIGEMARALTVFRDNGIEHERLKAEQRRPRRRPRSSAIARSSGWPMDFRRA